MPTCPVCQRSLSESDAACPHCRHLVASVSDLVRFPKEQSWTVGAAPDCTIVVDAPTVSGRHCRLIRAGQGFLLEDLGSTNGTYVNGTRSAGVQPVKFGDRISLGQSVPFPWDRIPCGTGPRLRSDDPALACPGD